LNAGVQKDTLQKLSNAGICYIYRITINKLHMRITSILLSLLLVIPAFSVAQTRTIDSLKQLLNSEQPDTSRVILLTQLSQAFSISRPDTAMVLSQQLLTLAKKIGYIKGEVGGLNGIANVFRNTGNYVKALEIYLQALKKAEAINDKGAMATTLSNMANVYADQGDERQAVTYTRQAIMAAKSVSNQRLVLTSSLNLGDSYENLNQLDSAKAYTIQAYDMALKMNNDRVLGIALNNLGNIYSKLGRNAVAMSYYRRGMPFLKETGIEDGLCETYLGMADLFQKAGNIDSSLYYAKQALAIAQNIGLISFVLQASSFLTSYYTSIHNVDSAFFYQSATIAAKDSLFSQEKQQEFQRLSYDETLRQQQIQEAKKEAQTQLKFNALFGGLGTLLVVAFLLFRNNRQKQKANSQLTHQKQKVESTLQELKSTQAQLVQREKMASLGELTAGIAHEIQNPLNFVNNFAQLNKEMLAEMGEEIERGNYEEVKNMASNIEANEEKIAHHGRRADAIVKGMLQHSRHSTGEKEPTHINAVADEYLRLSLFSIKTKNKTFNAILKTDYDKTIGKVSIVPQDIGRVLLNLFNNAFYAVQEKKKEENNQYQPTVSVSTKKGNSNIEIKVADNGTGIPKQVLDRIYQPFFTTKPPGQGTGLGLSLTYDIITKEHNGTIRVESKEGEGTVFIITLPC
jgi:signal transduction histidine kinase